MRREKGYDFSMWSESGEESGGFLIADAEGRALGGFAIGPDDRSVVLRWIWVAPPYRRHGWMRRSWAMLTDRFPGIMPEPPLSPAAAKFFIKIGVIEEYKEP